MKKKTSRLTGNIIYQEFYHKFSKRIINEIDFVIGNYLSFTMEEIDYITNFDIKYRIGQ